MKFHIDIGKWVVVIACFAQAAVILLAPNVDKSLGAIGWFVLGLVTLDRR